MLEEIKLDDREYDDIKAEAISNIIAHSPEWTNHNSSDPGITLIELFSAMSEMILYRLNQVPFKSYLAFLDLLGVKQRLPIPSRALVRFELAVGFEQKSLKKSAIELKEGFSVAAKDSESIIFQTDKKINLTNTKLTTLYQKRYITKDKIQDITDFSVYYRPKCNAGKYCK